MATPGSAGIIRLDRDAALAPLAAPRPVPARQAAQLRASGCLTGRAAEYLSPDAPECWRFLWQGQDRDAAVPLLSLPGPTQSKTCNSTPPVPSGTPWVTKLTRPGEEADESGGCKREAARGPPG